MTLNTGAERSGKTSRRKSCSQTAPIAEPASTSRTVSSGAADDSRIDLGDHERTLVRVMTGLALLGLRLQQERAFDH